MKSKEVKKAETRDEWKELGFHIVYDEYSQMWKIDGDRSGLSSLVKLLRDYTNDKRNAHLSEHEHYGPYMSFKVTTAEGPNVDSNSIYGTLSDIAQLVSLIETRLVQSKSGDEFIIGTEYSSGSGLRFRLHEDGFDPSVLDPMKWADS